MALEGVAPLFETREPDRRAGRRRFRNAGALAAALVLHLAFLLAVVWSNEQTGFAGGAGAQGGGGDAIPVSLVGPIEGLDLIRKPRAHAKTQAQARLEALARQLRADAPDALQAADHTVQGDLDQLLDEIAQERAAAQGGGTADQKPVQAKTPVRANGVEGKADERGDYGSATGDMWAQIQTCWRPTTAVPVTLELTIDRQGQLALPPRILRPDDAAADETRRRAEAQAVQSVATCAPYASTAPVFGTKTFRFVFAPPVKR